MGSVVIGGQRPLDGLAGNPVVPDGGGHGQQPLGDAGIQAPGGAATVAFQVELALEGVVDRFDPLPDPALEAGSPVTNDPGCGGWAVASGLLTAAGQPPGGWPGMF